MSIPSPNLLNEYHSVMLWHTCTQIQTIIDSQAIEYPDISTEIPIVRIGDGGMIANTPINENRPKFDSAYEESNLD